MHRFTSGTFDQIFVENAGETLFIVNLDKERNLGIIGEKGVKYANMVSCEESMTMMGSITGDEKVYLEPTLLISKNSSGSYPIRGVLDNVPDVSYRYSPKR